MGIIERREREKTERRKAILDCARDLILVNGVQRLSMEDIARKAEISKATVYLYFSSKEILLSEICEEAARGFMEYLKTIQKAGLTGMAALKYIWRGYVELFGNSDEMIIIFQIRNYLNSWIPIVSLKGHDLSSYVDSILTALKTLFDQCKAEGFFNPSLDSSMATRLLLSVFSIMVENAARIPAETRKSSVIITEMTNSFQILIWGFAQEGVDRNNLDITFRL
jgi:AcrR family transcriptional regulator